MNDPYRLLEVARDADAEAIKRAYRKLAKELHPDRNLGDLETEQRFKAMTQAYTLLSNPRSRRDYDRGRIDGDGKPMRRGFGGGAEVHQHQGGWQQGVETILDRLFKRPGRTGKAQPRSRPEEAAGPSATTKDGKDRDQEKDQPLRLDVDFKTAVLGGKQRLFPAGGKVLEIDIPPGTDDNAMLRLKGQGRSRRKGKPPDDLLVHIRVSEHPLLVRRGQDLHLDLPISLKEALFGARVRTPTIEGAVWLNIPANANSGQMLRLRGKGVPGRTGSRGDQYVRLMIMLPKDPSAAVAADLRRLADHDDDDDVRAHLDGY
jgi:DnaJ-class molecular chaperone